jgi:hypothetical protein
MAVKKTKAQPKENFFDRATKWINDFEGSFINFVSVFLPWLVTLIPATILYDHLIEIGWRPWVAFIAALVVEGLGLATVNTFFRFQRHNQKYKDQKNKMPAWLVVVVYLWYLVIVLFVNVVFDVVSGVAWTEIVAVTAFSTLSLPASVLIAVRGLFSEWKGEHDRRYARSDERSDEQKPVQVNDDERSDEQETVRPSDREQEIIAYLNKVYQSERRIPGPTEVAKALKLDPTKAKGYISGKTQEWKATLQANGASA